MSASEICARRAQFLTENAPEFLRAVSAQKLLGGNTPIRYNIGTVGGRLGALFESLASASELEFFFVCHCIVDTGHYVLFHRLLDQRLVDSESLEAFASDLVADRMPTVIDAIRRHRLKRRGVSPPSPPYLADEQREFLRRHAATASQILRVGPALFELLESAGVLAAEDVRQWRYLQPDDSTGALVDRIFGQSKSSSHLYKFCHALLVTGQYRLYSILHGIIDAKL